MIDRIVVRRDQGEPSLARQPVGDLGAVLAVAVVGRRPPRRSRGGGELRRRGHRRASRSRRVVPADPGRDRNGLRVVARRERHDAPPGAFGLGQGADLVVGAADLERTASLQVSAFSHTEAPSSRSRVPDVSTGVSWATPRSRAAAASMSAGPIMRRPHREDGGAAPSAPGPRPACDASRCRSQPRPGPRPGGLHRP